MTVSTALKRTFSMLTDAKLRLEFFLPNGLLLPLELDPELTLEEVKRELWLVASREPLFDRLHPVDSYILTGIDRDTGEVEEYYDQSVRIHQLPLLLPFLRLVDAVKDTGLAEANARNAVISSCVGVSHADIVRAAGENPEVRCARLRLLSLASLHARALQAEGPLGQARYLTASPQRQQLTKSFVDLIERRFLSPTTAGPLTITAWMLDGSRASARERRVYVNLDNPYATVKEAVDALLDAQLKMATQQSEEVKPGYPAEAYALKVCCTQAYLFDPSEPLVSYEYVQNCLEQGQLPCLSPMLLEDIGNFVSANFSDQHWKFCFGDRKPAEGASIAEQQPAEEYSRRIYQRLDSLVLGDDTNGGDEVAATLKSCQEEMDQDVDRYLSTIVPQAGDSWQKEQIPRVNELSAFSIWDLPAYLSIQVCGGQFLPFETVCGNNNNGAGAPLFPTAPQGSGAAGQQTAGVCAPANNGSGLAAQLYQGIYVVRVGLFHGSQSLIEYQTTSGVPGHQLEWNRWLGFHVCLADIPLAARLSVALIRLARTGERRSSKVYEYPVAWANLNFFDHCGFMVSGELELRLWPASLLLSTDDRFQGLYPAGTVLANPNPEVVLRICVFNPISVPIRRPSLRSPFTSPSPARSLTQTSLVSAAGNGDARKRLPITGQLFVEDDEERRELSEETAEEEESGIVSQPCHPHHLRHSAVVGLSTLAGSCRAGELEPPSPSLLQGIVSRDPLFELSEQDKDTLWCGRRLCQAMLPTVSLPWVAQSVCWYRREAVIEFYNLLLNWPRPLTTQVALQLLGAIGLSVIGLGGSSTGGGQCRATAGVGALAASGHQRGCANGAADALLRQLAVHSLQTLSDAELSDYLLQLVQSLKAEAYLDNPLSRFLLVRALRNPPVIGLRFFWHLRSELHVPDLRIRFGLLLEAFCHGCGPLLPYLARQVTALNRLETISARVKQAAPNSEDEQRVRFREEVSRVEAKRDLQWLPSPLGLSDRLGELVVHKCDVKRSKKKPLWLVWTNPDLLACHHNEHYQIIFKHGDDLRQDMLTLYLLRIMDRIWKDEGLDMCLMPYGCLATGLDMGLIEAVRNARTVMSIQGERLRSALQIDSTQLYRWLMQCLKEERTRQSAAEAAVEHRRPPVSDYEQVICNFTHSCAGYCVATFVMGIRDRHPDNIMVDTTGHLFHIDFGHILDNRKKKFGITRERVPFVLTKDFVTVIARGHPDATAAPPQPGASNTGGSPRPTDFQAFIQLCVRAYLMLRRHANLLLTLLAMMLPSGLPELTSAYDLEYVRETLAVDMPDESSASAYFLKKFNNAYAGAWTTKIDWFSHWMNT